MAANLARGMSSLQRIHLIIRISFVDNAGMRDLPPELLRAFVAVAETGSFTAAATLTHRSQSAVSMQIRRLEELLERRLLDRDAKPVRPTAEGERLLDPARRLLDQQRRILASFAGPRPRGRVRLGAAEDYAVRFLTDALAFFARGHPEVEIAVTCDLSGRLVDAMAQGRLDLALIARRGDGDAPGTVLGRERLVWALPRHRPPPPLDPLPLALMPAGCPFRALALAAVEATGRRWRTSFEANALSGVVAAVAAGLAVTVVAEGNLAGALRAAGAEAALPALPAIDIVRLGPEPEAAEPVHALAATLTAGVTL